MLVFIAVAVIRSLKIIRCLNIREIKSKYCQPME